MSEVVIAMFRRRHRHGILRISNHGILFRTRLIQHIPHPYRIRSSDPMTCLIARLVQPCFSGSVVFGPETSFFKRQGRTIICQHAEVHAQRRDRPGRVRMLGCAPSSGMLTFQEGANPERIANITNVHHVGIGIGTPTAM